MPDKMLERTMFETSRVLEYFTERELSYQTGRSKSEWPLVILKELMDNALDACEASSIPPEIKVNLHDGDLFTIVVEDNGLGIKPDVITKILNFQTRTSDKEAYVSPSRGAQGNALKTIFAIPYVLSTNTPQEGVCEIESNGIHHIITVKLDMIKQEPRIEHKQVEIVKSLGCRVTAHIDKSCVLWMALKKGDFYKFSGTTTCSIHTYRLPSKPIRASYAMRLQIRYGRSGDQTTSPALCGTAPKTSRS